VPHQSWIVASDVKLLSVHHWPTDPPIGTAILLAGFSHSMSDMDYFMSRLARQLSASGLLVAQVDPRGHGDSPGRFSDVTLDSMREDIRSIVRHHIERHTRPVIGIGRGLAATLLAERGLRDGLAGVAGVMPYCIDPTLVPQAVSGTTADAYEVFPGNDYVNLSDFTDSTRCILNALGVVPYNLHGTEVSAELLKQLATFDSVKAFRREDQARSLWLFPGSAGVHAVRVGDAGCYPPLDAYRGDQFLLRNPKSQQQAIAALRTWVRTLSIS
jgi:pimeloyl-ACP methyl ester carboxylesterase